MTRMTESQPDLLEKFNKRFRAKKHLNLGVSALLLLLGVSSFLFGLTLEPSVIVLRFMTVDGTLFTTAGALAYIIINLVESRRTTELTSIPIYYIRLSAAVAEMVILTVVLISHLPFSSESIPMFDRYDSFVMHVAIPPLMLFSFVINDAPIGKLKPGKIWHGTWFVSFYAVVILSLICSGTLEHSLIPYFFLDVTHNPLWLTLGAFVIVYGIAYFMSWMLSELNRRLSWLWYRGFSK